MTTNLDFSKWPQVFNSEQLTGALLDRLTHHAHILTMNGESYWFKRSMSRRKNNDPLSFNQAVPFWMAVTGPFLLDRSHQGR